MATIAEQLTSLANTKTAIKDAIVAKGVTVADDTPFSGYAAKIGQIQAGGGAPATKFGASVDTFLGDVNENGVLSVPTADLELNLVGVKNIASYALSYRFRTLPNVKSANLSLVESVGEQGLYGAFYDCDNLVSIDLSSVTMVGSYGLAYVCYGCPSLTVAKIDSIKTVSGFGLYNAFYGCSKLIEADLHSIESCDGSGMANAFNGCAKLTNVNLGLLKTVGNNGMQYIFDGCTALVTINLDSLTTLGTSALIRAFAKTKITTISFPSLTSVQSNSFASSSSNGAFRDCTSLTEIHFRADMQAKIEAMSQYANKWGAPTSCAIFFDL